MKTSRAGAQQAHSICTISMLWYSSSTINGDRSYQILSRPQMVDDQTAPVFPIWVLTINVLLRTFLQTCPKSITPARDLCQNIPHTHRGVQTNPKKKDSNKQLNSMKENPEQKKTRKEITNAATTGLESFHKASRYLQSPNFHD